MTFGEISILTSKSDIGVSRFGVSGLLFYRLIIQSSRHTECACYFLNGIGVRRRGEVRMEQRIQVFRLEDVLVLVAAFSPIEFWFKFLLKSSYIAFGMDLGTSRDALRILSQGFTIHVD